MNMPMPLMSEMTIYYYFEIVPSVATTNETVLLFSLTHSRLSLEWPHLEFPFFFTYRFNQGYYMIQGAFKKVFF